jgi:hypothetical protein
VRATRGDRPGHRLPVRGLVASVFRPRLARPPPSNPVAALLRPLPLLSWAAKLLLIKSSPIRAAALIIVIAPTPLLHWCTIITFFLHFSIKKHNSTITPNIITKGTTNETTIRIASPNLVCQNGCFNFKVLTPILDDARLLEMTFVYLFLKNVLHFLCMNIEHQNNFVCSHCAANLLYLLYLRQSSSGCTN